ncbi:hypothetical protein AWM75_08355 [Aerococcus urinaehominis]|uniref:Uncharacterized protein n=1 Tax=Aerococcus urinaehominis TaxID=128944 RepID=A0A109RH77_9LACT|nr:response regulator [Aerococcus urinaehominis]AMB99981.1 hypothetical protein AWM75_08355 [Aerococcus urinaehominis]SDM45568.1 Response regulator receiver domain-containing protein [Aerococcus urinaehominis]
MKRLVIIEDEEWIRKWLVYGVDYSQVGALVVGEASDGAEGLALIEESQPDIVLTDITMPIMSAFDMFQATDLDFQKIIISGYSDFENAKKAIQFGVVNFVTKPINEEELLASVAEAVKRASDEDRDQQAHSELLAGLLIKEDEIIKDLLAYIHDHYNEKLTMAIWQKRLVTVSLASIARSRKRSR